MRFMRGNRIGYLTAVAAVIVITTQGCATKFYGRQDGMAGHEKESMVCHEIDLELTRTAGFVDHVNEKSAFSGLDVVAFLIDFGLGNYLEKTAALDSAKMRSAALRELHEKKQCTSASL